MNTTVSKLVNTLVASLTSRQREVMLARFGLEKNGEPQTLASIGDRSGVTRERIRQIEAGALASLRREAQRQPACMDVLAATAKYLASVGGVAPRADLVSAIAGRVQGFNENHAALFIEISKAFHFYPEDKEFFPFYYLDKDHLKNAVGFVNQWASFLRTKKEEVLSGRYHAHLDDFVKRKGVAKDRALQYLSISKKVKKNPYNDMGLSEWPEINPTTIRDRVYLVLKKKAAPLHFTAIAKMINEVGFDRRPASAPTVHNELIKDERFVLVGRGMYGLAEHGYEPGTAREVIHRVLRKQGPLRPKDVILAIQKERFFKQNTILVNLQNKRFFLRKEDGRYQVREA